MSTSLASRPRALRGLAVIGVVVAAVSAVWTAAGAFYLGTLLSLCLLAGAVVAGRKAGTSAAALAAAIILPGLIVFGFFAIIFGGGGLVPPD